MEKKRKNIILHECIENIQKYIECPDNQIAYNYEIIIYEDGNVIITREMNRPLNSGEIVKHTILETFDSKEMYPLIVDYYKDILDNVNRNLPSEYVELELLKIKNLLEIDTRFVEDINYLVESLKKKNFYYKMENENLKIMNNNYKVDIRKLKNIIVENQDNHSNEVKQLIATINKMCDQLY